MAGGKYGAENRRRTRRAIPVEPPTQPLTWNRPPSMETIETVDCWVDLGTSRIIERVVRDSATYRVVEFALNHVVLSGGQDITLRRIDTSHGEVHRHRLPRTPDGELTREHMRWIERQEDVEEAFQPARDEMYSTLEIDERSWRHG